MNPYKVLGIPRTASEQEVARAYRSLALRFHPDRNPDGAAQFKTVSAAYEILSDPLKRQLFDEHGVVDSEASAGGCSAHRSEEEQSAEMAAQVAAFYRSYAGSDEEAADLAKAYEATSGDFRKIVGAHALFDNGVDGEVRRIHAVLSRLISQGQLTENRRWKTSSTAEKVKETEKAMEAERREAEAALKKIHGDHVPKCGGGTASLQALILSRQTDHYESMLSNLEAKYGKAKSQSSSARDEAAKPPKKTSSKRQRE